MSVFVEFLRMLGGGPNGDGDEDDIDIDTTILNDNTIQRSASTFSLDVPLDPSRFRESDYFLHWPIMGPLIQSWLLTRYEGQLCPFFSLLYAVGRGNRTGELMAEDPNETLATINRRIAQCNKRFIIISLVIESGKSAHQNVIFLDQKMRTAERYEPHHLSEYKRDSWYPAPALDKALAQYFDSLELRYFPPLDYCISIPGLQTEFDYSEGGWCVMFAYLYAEYRIKFPDLDRRQIVRKLYEKLNRLQRKGKLRTYLNSYVRNIQKFAEKIASFSPGTKLDQQSKDSQRIVHIVKTWGDEKQRSLTVPDIVQPDYGPDVEPPFTIPIPPVATLVPPSRPAPRPPSTPKPAFPQYSPNVPYNQEFQDILVTTASQISAIVRRDPNLLRERKKDFMTVFRKTSMKGQYLTWKELRIFIDYILFLRDIPVSIVAPFFDKVQETYPEFLDTEFGRDCLPKILYYTTLAD